MQDTMVYALTNVAHFDSQRASFTAWLHTITVSQCRDYVLHRGMPQGQLNEQSTKPQDVSQTVIWRAIDDLSSNLREAIVLRYWCRLTYQEMAQILRCPSPTAQSRVRLAYDQLYRLLDPVEEAAPGGENLR